MTDHFDPTMTANEVDLLLRGLDSYQDLGTSVAKNLEYVDAIVGGETAKSTTLASAHIKAQCRGLAIRTAEVAIIRAKLLMLRARLVAEEMQKPKEKS